MKPKLAIEPGSSLAYKTGDWRTQQPLYRDKWPPCSQTCPASEDIQAWLALASDGQWQAAWQKLTERNPFPATMGRICYHTCESPCNRNHLDSAVNIHGMERYLGDLAIRNGWQHKAVSDQSQSQKIAVVGAGPAGLSCAYQLIRHGYSATIFDAKAEPGGTLRSGIPDYRLPKLVLAKEIDAILALGIELNLNTRVGVDISETKLRNEFDAIFLAIGTQQPRSYQSEDSSTHGVMSGINFLHRLNHDEQLILPSQVAVVGGGNTAVDVARCARRLGSAVTLLCPQDHHGSHRGQLGTEMPASKREVIEAEADGVQLRFRIAVSRLVRNGKHFAGVEIAHVDQVYDRQGNFNPVLFEGTEEFVAAGLVIFAIGQEADWQGLESLNQANTSDRVWIGGDAAAQPKLAAAAVGSGYLAAKQIMATLKDEPPVYDGHKKSHITFKQMQLHYYPKQCRNEGKMIEHRLEGFDEVIKGLSDGEALHEANRCLSCGVCFECNNCWHFCPDAAVIKRTEKYEIDYDYCKGCGICANECPCGHIDMEPIVE